MDLIRKFQSLKPRKRLIYSLVAVFLFTVYLDIRYDDIFRASNAFGSYISLFWLFSYGLVFGMAFIYFTFTKDKSETFAFIASYFILLYTGVHDLIFYIIKQRSIPSAMDHLFKHPVIGKIAEAMGESNVTPTTLIVSVVLGLIITGVVVKGLWRV